MISAYNKRKRSHVCSSLGSRQLAVMFWRLKCNCSNASLSQISDTGQYSWIIDSCHLHLLGRITREIDGFLTQIKFTSCIITEVIHSYAIVIH